MPAFTRRQYAGAAAATTTTNALTSSDTSVTLASTTGFPSTASVPFYVVIDPGTSAEEKCSATISGATLTLTRAQDDTTAVAHTSGATIYPVFTANDADEANEVVSKLTTKGDLLVTTGSALNRLAVGTNDFALLADSAATNGVSWKQIPAAGLASDAVTTAKILDANVTAGKLASNAVETAKILDANVTGAKLANLTVSTKTASYTLVAADRNTRIAMNSGSNTTVTVNTSLFAAGDIVYIHNISTGTCTVTAGTATVTTSGSLALAQWGGGTLYFTSASAAIFFPYGGIGYGVATGGSSSSITVSGTNYTLLSFTTDSTLTVTKAGLFDVLMVGGGGAAYRVDNASMGHGGGAAGGIIQSTVYLSANQTVVVGAGGAAAASLTATGVGRASSVGTGPTALSAIGGNMPIPGGGGFGLSQCFFGSGVGSINSQAVSGVSNTQGNIGGTSTANAGGGGGGFGAVGGNAVTTTGGAGGAGYDVGAFISGSLFKGAGGGAGGSVAGGAGGSSVGGAGGTTTGNSAAANTGSGGGGGVAANATGSGGSGIVYVRFKV